ncbi:hypothetical protein [Vagococcus fluvialis]|uniref:hypothetical protein n=1 Tax=Vagococcus fluvialis TaxID=2738 RepID=UPI0037BC87F6
MNTRHRLIKKSVMNVLKNEYSRLQRIELYETCFKGGDLERQGFLSGIPSENEFDRSYETVEREFNTLFYAINLNKLDKELRQDLLCIYHGLEDWPVEDILEVVEKV